MRASSTDRQLFAPISSHNSRRVLCHRMRPFQIRRAREGPQPTRLQCRAFLWQCAFRLFGENRRCSQRLSSSVRVRVASVLVALLSGPVESVWQPFRDVWPATSRNIREMWFRPPASGRSAHICSLGCQSTVSEHLRARVVYLHPEKRPAQPKWKVTIRSFRWSHPQRNVLRGGLLQSSLLSG